jgi:hypothetical protein
MLRRALFVWLPLVALLGILLSPNTTPARPAAEGEGLHRALRATLFHLKEARAEIKETTFPGKHRERVERDITTAIREIEGALKEGKIDIAYVPPTGWRDKYKSFHNLRQALVELDTARGDLRNSKEPWFAKKEFRTAIDDAHAHVKEALEELK